MIVARVDQHRSAVDSDSWVCQEPSADVLIGRVGLSMDDDTKGKIEADKALYGRAYARSTLSGMLEHIPTPDIVVFSGPVDWANLPSALRERLEKFKELRAQARPNVMIIDAEPEHGTPIPMPLFCPKCREQHIDEGEFATRPHRLHTCQNCGLTWKQAEVNTVGVKFLPGTGNK